MRKRSKGVKYSRVTKQQKYIFLSLVIQRGQSLHEAAFNAGIQYSTGKTILFFYKNKHNNYGNYQIKPTDQLAQIYNFASYRAITPQLSWVRSNSRSNPFRNQPEALGSPEEVTNQPRVSKKQHSQRTITFLKTPMKKAI